MAGGCGDIPQSLDLYYLEILRGALGKYTLGILYSTTSDTVCVMEMHYTKFIELCLMIKIK